ncbi:MAG: ABC transporter ATP-binding protein [Crenarchaeota archaeon]|nr:ABC transporter ATP-binding protein [Thermoproteota archaeon]
MPEKILSVRGLKVWFPVKRATLSLRPKKLFVRAVDGVYFDVYAGEVFCLAGESGCGKTTTGKAVIRLIDEEFVRGGKVWFKPSPEVYKIIASRAPRAVRGEEGFVSIYDVPGRQFKPLRREMQIVFQDPFSSLNPRYRVRQILEEPLIIHRIGDKEERLEKVRKALMAVKLTPPEEFMERFPHQLSGGQRQRVAIARALILNPRFIVADEIVSMLDVSIRAEILELLLDLRDRYGIAFIFITHDLALAKHVCDRIAIMYLGKIVEIGPADRVIDNPLHPYTRALVAAIPEPDPRNRAKIREVPIKGEVPSPINIPKGCRFRPRCVVYDSLPEEEKSSCEREEPQLVEVERDHYVACWLYGRR